MPAPVSLSTVVIEDIGDDDGGASTLITGADCSAGGIEEVKEISSTGAGEGSTMGTAGAAVSTVIGGKEEGASFDAVGKAP